MQLRGKCIGNGLHVGRAMMDKGEGEINAADHQRISTKPLAARVTIIIYGLYEGDPPEVKQLLSADGQVQFCASCVNNQTLTGTL